VSAGKPFAIHAQVAGIDTGQVQLQINRAGGPARIINMVRDKGYWAEVPADLCTPGQLNYRIICRKGNDYVVFPGNIKGNPFAWDYYQNETWQTRVAATNGPLELFNPATDKNFQIYPSGQRRNAQSLYTTGDTPGRLLVAVPGFQYYFGDKVKGRAAELNTFNKLIIRARATTGSQHVKVTLIDANAVAMSTPVTLTNSFSNIEVPLNNLQPDSALLLPRPYPGFQPLWFKAAAAANNFQWQQAEKIQLTVVSDQPISIEIASIWMQKE
jgi:hypothetical protein